jgi:hypothetical protein
VFLQGSAVVHRAEPSRSPAGRISLVSALDPVQAGYPDRNRPWLVATGYGADGNGALEEAARLADLARGKAWRSRNLLDQFLADDVWSLGPEEVVRRLTESVRDIVQAATVIRAGEITMEQALGRHLKQEQELARRHRGGS